MKSWGLPRSSLTAVWAYLSELGMSSLPHMPFRVCVPCAEDNIHMMVHLILKIR